MKIQNSFLYRWLVCAVIGFLLVASTAFASEAMKRGLVVVTGVKGGVLFSTPIAAEPKPLKIGDTLKQGATILTGKGAVADLAFSNGSVLQVGEGSKFVIQEFTQADWQMDKESFDNLQSEPTTSKTTLYLDFGDVIADVKKLNKGSSLEVATPLGTAGVRGTAFQLSARRGPGGRPQQVQLIVARGQVNLGGAGTQQVSVNAGFSSVIGSGGPQGDTPGTPVNNPTSVDASIIQVADGLRGGVDAASAEKMNVSQTKSVTAEQQQALEQAAQQGEDALVEAVTRLVTESPEQAVGVAEAAAEQMPVAAPRIAEAAAIVSPNDGIRIAAEVSAVIPPSAPEVAAAVARVLANDAPLIAVAVSNVVPTLTPEIAAAVVSVVPQSTLAVARAVAAAHSQQADKIANAISQTGGGLDSEAIKNAVQQGVQDSTGAGGATGGQVSPPVVPESDRSPLVPPVKPTLDPKPTPTPVPSGV